MKNINDAYIGDQTRWFIGRVVDVNDPLQVGRYRVRVFGIHSQDVEEVSIEDLPWAQALVPATEGGGSGIGAMPQIKNNSLVFGVFLDGKGSQVPLIIGSFITIEQPSEDQIENTSQSKQNQQSPDPRNRQTGTVPIDNSKSSPEERTSQTTDDRMIGSTNAEKIFNFFVARGYTPEQASGFVGNFFAESSLDPTALNPDDKGKPAFGLAQWRGDRYDGLRRFSAVNTLDYTTLHAQLLYTVYELNGSEKRANSKLKSAKTAREAAYMITRYYERPEYEMKNGKYTSPSLSKRIDFAENTFERYAIS